MKQCGQMMPSSSPSVASRRCAGARSRRTCAAMQSDASAARDAQQRMCRAHTQAEPRTVRPSIKLSSVQSLEHCKRASSPELPRAHLPSGVPVQWSSVEGDPGRPQRIGPRSSRGGAQHVVERRQGPVTRLSSCPASAATPSHLSGCSHASALALQACGAWGCWPALALRASSISCSSGRTLRCGLGAKGLPEM